MARILDVSACSSTNIFYTKSGTFQFLEDAHKDTAADIIRGIIGESYDYNKAYALYGCNIVNIIFEQFSEGAVFFRGEVFHAPTQGVITHGVGEVHVLDIDTTQYTTFADPIDFTDGIPRNVHNIRQVKYNNAPTGTGTICDYADLIYVYPDIENKTSYDGDTIRFERERTIVYTSASVTSIAVTLDLTNARIGTTVTIKSPVTSITGFTILTSGVSLITPNTVTPIDVAWTQLFHRFKYLGTKGSSKYFSLEQYGG